MTTEQRKKIIAEIYKMAEQNEVEAMRKEKYQANYNNDTTQQKTVEIVPVAQAVTFTSQNYRLTPNMDTILEMCTPADKNTSYSLDWNLKQDIQS